MPTQIRDNRAKRMLQVLSAGRADVKQLRELKIG
jgi:hypothetical protein